MGRGIFVMCYLLVITGCFKTQRSRWERNHTYHTGWHDVYESRRWDTTLILRGHDRVGAIAIEYKCSYPGCPMRDTFYLIDY